MKDRPQRNQLLRQSHHTGSIENEERVYCVHWYLNRHAHKLERTDTCDSLKATGVDVSVFTTGLEKGTHVPPTPTMIGPQQRYPVGPGGGIGLSERNCRIAVSDTHRAVGRVIRTQMRTVHAGRRTMNSHLQHRLVVVKSALVCMPNAHKRENGRKERTV